MTAAAVIPPPGPGDGECLQRWQEAPGRGEGDHEPSVRVDIFQSSHRELHQPRGNRRTAAGGGAGERG